ncbi:serine/threonine-protein kinase PDIK1L [Paramormyrops kingsleyae]|uniref:Si:ch211-63o20.7 n=1 Tax=Paramormyrops kingsleyae TaxID=1676925 RepID=A0A3B3QED1_9TELE|nr:serine/threonine-protein kinase PDIK1L-like [Paramormyrops kingsleyae]
MEKVYILEREVGRGSYGVVFEGRVAKTGPWGTRGDRVAIKRLPCSSPECIELFLQELWAMRATARSHPNVIALHCCLHQNGPNILQPLGAGKLPLDLVESALKGSVKGSSPTHKGTATKTRGKMLPLQPAAISCSALWLVMEYCDGGDLNRYLLSRPPDTQRNYSVIQQLSSAVAFLHKLRIVHRDLKPDNVLVQNTPAGPLIKVADFGLSKMSEGLAEGHLNRKCFSSTCGSDFYMAPEVWAGRSYTDQADIFSLGVLFWAVLERITFLEDGSTQEQLGAYACRGRWLVPLGEALSENPDLQLGIPMRARRASPLPAPPTPQLCALLLDMLASDPASRPTACQLEERVHSATTSQ